MDRKQVIARYCALGFKVNSKMFHFHIPADCFCKTSKDFHYAPEILDFIERAVEEKIAKHIPVTDSEV